MKNNGFYTGINQGKIDELVKLAKTGKYSCPKLAKIFNCNRKTIFRALSRNNIRLSNLGKFKRKFSCDDNFFDKLNPISAYWLGFIAADGCVLDKTSCLRIGLSMRDKIHLKKFLNAVKSKANIHYIKSNNSVAIEIFSKKIIGSLLNLGIKPRKSLTIENVNIPEKLVSHFIRGIFDGDGSISGNKRTHVQFQIAGNKPFLKQIQNILVKECNLNKIKIYSLSKDNKAYRLQYTGIQIFRILDFIYRNSKVETRLERKYQKYLYFKERFK